MIVVASKNGNVGMNAALGVLRQGGSAIDAVESAMRLVEENPEDHSVGYNGWPNILGELELDASVMDGDTLNSGAVAALTRTPYAFSVARKVMEVLPHVLLAGSGSDRFAAEMGFEQWHEMYDETVRSHWRQRLESEFGADEMGLLMQRQDLHQWVKLTTDPKRTYGTVNFIAQDASGTICAGVSTSGWAWKFPGRVGDSPIIGAGNYADSRYGAAACTGMGEMAIRASTAHTIVMYLKMGVPLDEACRRAMSELNDLGGRFLSHMNLIALDAQGNHAGFTSSEGRTYIFQTADMETYQEVPRSLVAINRRWDHG